jgi:hypothetical protein
MMMMMMRRRKRRMMMTVRVVVAKAVAVAAAMMMADNDDNYTLVLFPSKWGYILFQNWIYLELVHDHPVCIFNYKVLEVKKRYIRCTYCIIGKLTYNSNRRHTKLC